MTLKELKESTAAGLNQDAIRELEGIQKKSAPVLPTAWMWGQLVAWSLKTGNIVVDEHRFSSERRFRFDFCAPHLKIGIEYEGLMSEKSGHTTLSGYTKDTEKYNLAAAEGWRVIRFTVKNYKTVISELEKLTP